MKKLFTLLFCSLFLVQVSFAQDPGFYPPEGSTFNADSSAIELPEAYVGFNYDETISFYASDSITIDVAGVAVALPFVSAVITNVTTPPGMTYSCNVESCAFEPGMWGEVTLSGIPDTAGNYTLDLTAVVTINTTPFGLPGEQTFPIPYDGSNPILNFALGDDYSAINSFVPSFSVNVSNEVGVEELSKLSDVIVAPNPASNNASFTFNNEVQQDLTFEVYDVLGNLVYSKNTSFTIGEQTLNLNTSTFKNGVYIYSLKTNHNTVVGRLLVQK